MSRVSLAYGYGPLGNVTSRFDAITGVGYSNVTYDALGRLYNATLENGSGNHARHARYAGGGNLHSRTGTGTYTYGTPLLHAVTQITHGSTTTHYAYNGVGEMTSGGSLTDIQWTRGGRVKKLTGNQSTTLEYGASGALVKKTVSGATSRYFGKLLVKTGNSYRARIIANGQVIALIQVSSTGTTTTHYMVHDAQGSPAAILNQDGTLEARFAFNAWGELVNPQTGTGTDPNTATKQALTTIGYTGHEALWSAHLVHTYARLYNPHLGRWLSPDTSIPGMYNPQALNRYSYVLNDPLTLSDENGHWPDVGYLPNQQLGANHGLYAIGGNPRAWLGFGQMLLGAAGYLGVGAEDLSVFGAVLNGATITFSTDMFVNGAENFWNGMHDKPFADSPLDTAIGSNKNKISQDAFTGLGIIADPEKSLSNLLKYLANQGLEMAKKRMNAPQKGGHGGAGGGGRRKGRGQPLFGSHKDCMIFQAYVVHPDGSRTPIGAPWVQCVVK